MGTTLGEHCRLVYNDDVILPLDKPVERHDGRAARCGNLAPDGAVIKPAAMEPHLRKHQGKAVVFRTHNDMSAHDPPRDLRSTRTACCWW